MKNNERENDVFDELLRDALASDAAPSEDFTARLMEQVRRTPQKKAKNRPYKKILAAVAACAVIAVAIPLVTGGMGSSAADQAASADSAAPEAAMNNADNRAGGDNQMVYSTFPNTDSTGGAPDDGLNSQFKQDEVPSDNENLQTLTLTGQDARDAKAALDAVDIQPAKTETDRYIYVLTEQQAQELGRTVDALYGVEGSLTLILEVTE